MAKEFKIYDDTTLNEVVLFLQKLDLTKSFKVKITQKREVRTLDQNRLYWLYMNCIADETGYTPNEIHDYLRGLFLPKEARNVFNDIQINLTSTTTLDTKQMTDYINRIIVWAVSELQITLPDPKDKYFEAFYEQYKNYI